MKRILEFGGFSTGIIGKLLIVLLTLLGAKCINDTYEHTAYYENGQLKEKGMIKDGVKDGLWTYYHENGQKSVEINFENGIKNGPARAWFDNGNLYNDLTYSHDQFFDTLIHFHRNGQKNYQTYYNESGREQGLFQLWYEDGTLSQIGTHEDGKMVGLWEKYHEDGTLGRLEYYDENGKKDSVWYYFNENGDTTKIEKYENNSKVWMKDFPKEIVID